MSETWPNTVRHQPLAGSLQVTPFRPPLVTDMEDGIVRRRRSTTLRVATLSFSLGLTGDEYADFAAWVQDTLIDGSLSFDAEVWKDGAYVTRTCSLVGGTYQAAARGRDGFTVTLSLDVEDY